MKITDVKAVYPNYQHVPVSWRTHLWQIVVRVETNTGATGYGYGGGGVAAVEVVNRHLREILIDQEINNVADVGLIWDRLYYESLPYGRKGIGIMALSGVDLALWDLLGKSERKPVYELLGPRQKTCVRAYATGMDFEWYQDMGFTAHKFPNRWVGDKLDYDKVVNHAARIRELFGPDAMVMIDTYMSWSTDVTIEMGKRLKEHDIYWFEDVLTPDDMHGQAGLRSKIGSTLIAGGEHEFTHFGFRDLARSAALDLWQPDITWCGGMTAGLRILDIAREIGIPVVPHRGGEIWGLHLIVSSDCLDLAEQNPGKRGAPRDELWVGQPSVIDGYIQPTGDPGFGVSVNDAML